MMSEEQGFLMRLLTIRKIISDKGTRESIEVFKDCLALILKLRSGRSQFTNIPLANEIGEGVEVLEEFVGFTGKYDEAVNNIDKIAESMVKVFAKYGIE